MTPDYLDLLLSRETRTLPLAEPRLADGVASLSSAPIWGEVVEERAAPYLPPTAVETPIAPSERPPTRRQSAGRPEPASTVPPRVEEVIEHRAEAPRRDREMPPAPIQIERTIAEREIREVAIRNESIRSEPAQTSPKVNEPKQAAADRLFPPVRIVEAGYRPGVAARREERAAPPPAPTQPVTIRIDRIEVRAAAPAAAAAVPRPRAAPRLGLDEYLNRKKGGGR